jgi:nitroreductase
MTAEGRPELTVDELLTTTRSVRRRLDLDRPVPRSILEECLRIAFQAPNASNAQNWGWVLVDDPVLRRRMADLYRRGGELEQTLHPPDTRVNESGFAITRMGPRRLIANFELVPVLVVPAFKSIHAATRTTFEQASHWSSIAPAVWSLMLALRSRGLGSTWTTWHLHFEDEMAELLAIPPGYVQAGMLPVAYSIGTDFRPADRSFSEERIFWNRWTS